MSATGNEVARLEQLKGVFPQAVSLVSGRDASITLGNGREVTFSHADGVDVNVHLLVRAMYNSFELLQGVTDGTNVLIQVQSPAPMKTFRTKTLGRVTGKVYIIANDNLDALSIDTGFSFNFTISNNFVAFVGALIYVD